MIIKILFWGTNRQQGTLPYGKTFHSATRWKSNKKYGKCCNEGTEEECTK